MNSDIQNTTYRFTVIIPTHNRLEYLKETLDSLSNQDEKNFEVIIIDDGSTDGTWDYLQTWKPLFEFTLLKNETSKGPAAARNLGARHAKGGYLIFLDSDDLWFPWTLSSFHSVINKYRYPSIVSGNLMLLNKKADLTNISHQPFKRSIL